MKKIILIPLTLLTFAYGTSLPTSTTNTNMNKEIEKMRVVSKIKNYFFEKNNEIIGLIQSENTCIKAASSIEDINNCKKESKKLFTQKKKELFKSK